MMKKVLLTLSLVAVLGFTGCSKTNTNNSTGQEANQTVDYAAQLEEIHTAVKDAYGEDYVPEMPVDAETLESLFGITPDMYDAYVAEMPMMSGHVDTFIGIHPVEGKKQEVLDALNAYRDYQINEVLQYPMNLSKIQASEVKEMGDYVFFYMLGFTNELYDDEASELAAYQELNKIAEDAINGVLNK